MAMTFSLLPGRYHAQLARRVFERRRDKTWWWEGKSLEAVQYARCEGLSIREVSSSGVRGAREGSDGEGEKKD